MNDLLGFFHKRSGAGRKDGLLVHATRKEVLQLSDVVLGGHVVRLSLRGVAQQRFENRAESILRMVNETYCKCASLLAYIAKQMD